MILDNQNWLDVLLPLAYNPSGISLKIDDEKVHGYSCDKKYFTTVTVDGSDIHIFLQGTSLWSDKLKSKIGESVRVDLSYENDQPEGMKSATSENFIGIVTSFQASFGQGLPEVVVHISGCEYKRRQDNRLMRRLRPVG